MLPYKDDNPQLLVPIGTYVLIGLNVLTWILIQSLGMGSEFTESVCEYGLFATYFTGAEVNACGSNNIGQLGIFTSMFLHGSWIHLLGNLLFLWVFGGNVEDAMGTIRFIIFYLLSGISAAFFQIYSDPTSLIPMIGASGAIGGVMGAYLILYPKVKVHLFVFFIIPFPIKVPAYAMLGYWFGLQLISGLMDNNVSGGVAFWAHVGGFIGGIVFGYLLKDDELLCGHEFYGWSKQLNPIDIWNKPENKHKND